MTLHFIDIPVMVIRIQPVFAVRNSTPKVPAGEFSGGITILDFLGEKVPALVKLINRNVVHFSLLVILSNQFSHWYKEPNPRAFYYSHRKI